MKSSVRISSNSNSNDTDVVNIKIAVSFSDSVYMGIHGEISFLFRQWVLRRPMELIEIISFYLKGSN